MVLKEITVKNFFSYAEEQTLDLTGNGLTSVNSGNGMGKTCLLVEAPLFCLFGKTRSDKIDDCVNRYVGKDCKVSVTFEDDDGELYKVIRYRKHTDKGNSVLIFKGEKNISCKNAKDTDALIVDLFGMPYIAFCNSTIFSSELYSNFLSAKNSERLVVFENLLNLKQINFFYVQIKEILKQLSESESEIKLRKNEKETKISSFEETISSYSSQAKEKLLELKKEKEENEKAIEKARKSIEELSVVDVISEKKKLSSSELKKEYEKQIREKEEFLKSLELTIEQEYLDVYETFRDFDFEASEREERKFKECSESIKAKESELEKSKILLDSSVEKKFSLKKEKDKNEREVEKQEKDLERVRESICPYCGQSMNEEETKKKRLAIEKKIEECKVEIAGISKELENEEIRYKDFTEAYDMLVSDIKLLKDARAKMVNFTPNSKELEASFLNAKEKVELYNIQKVKNDQKSETTRKEIEELRKKSSGIELSKYTEEYLNSIEDEIEKQNKLIAESSSKIDAINRTVKSVYDKKYVEGVKEKIEDAKKELEEIDKELKELLYDKKHYEYLGECCSNKSGGFKKFFINEMIPVFNEKINQYLPFFFNDVRVEINFDKDLNDTISVDGKEIYFSSFSRGQKTRIELAAAFALFSLSRIFFSNKSGLLVVDELLDLGLDEYGVKAAISILETIAQEAKVFVVSHNPVVKDNIDSVIEIKRDDNGFSYIR